MQFDIIIIGGGMVGAAMASTLRSSPFKVAMIDATPTYPAQDHRLIALNYSSICLLKNLGVWPLLAPNAAAIKEVHVSQRGHFGATRLTAAETKLPELGYVVPAKYINPALYENLDNITLIRPATLKNLEQEIDHVALTVTTPTGTEKITAKIVIGADGTHSTVRQLLNIPTETFDYQQSALVTVTELRHSHHHVAYERFLQTGAIAMLPLVGAKAATIWTDSRENIDRLMQLNDSAFLETLQKQFGYRLGRFKAIEQRYTYPLKMLLAEQQTKQRVTLIGNALHTLHPIAAQGLNLALYEIAQLYEHFSHQEIDTLSLSTFMPAKQKISTSLAHNLSWLFAQDFFIMNTARQIGMLGLDLCQPLKARFTRHAIGQTGRVPPLLMEQEDHETNRTRY